jgi:hypothetical protein
MPYVIPAMPLVLNVWHQWDPTSVYAAPDVIKVPCNLSPGKRTFLAPFDSPFLGDIFNAWVYAFPMEVLLPKLQDIRAPDLNGTLPDCLEIPGGSGRLYFVSYVDDIGKGFANEHRFAIAYRAALELEFADAVVIPVPIPLP